MNKKALLTVVLGVVGVASVYAADGKMGADRHVARGVACTVCHGNDMKNPEYPDENTCTKCHVKQTLAEKTKNVKPTNPHAAPHNGDCTLCHMQHEKPVDYCDQCHKFGFKVP